MILILIPNQRSRSFTRIILTPHLHIYVISVRSAPSLNFSTSFHRFFREALRSLRDLTLEYSRRSLSSIAEALLLRRTPCGSYLCLAIETIRLAASKKIPFPARNA